MTKYINGNLKNPDLFLFFAIVSSAIVLILVGTHTYNVMEDVLENSKQTQIERNYINDIPFFDEVLTNSALLAATTGDAQWEKRYRLVEPKLDNDIKYLIRLDTLNNLHKMLKLTDNDLFSTINKKKMWTGEGLNKRKDGNDFPIQLSLSPLLDDKGELIAIAGVARDITERKQTDAEIKKTNAALIKLNAEKDKFFSIIAHDLKTPFNSIIGFSEILVEQVKEKNYQGIEEYTGIILQSSQRAMGLLMNLMEWSRSQTGKMEFNPAYFQMTELINEVELLLDNAAGQKSIVITNTLPDNIAVYADKNMMSTVLRNLISNAIKFTHPRGEIIISVEEKEELTVSVSDNGIGIAKDRIEQLFRIDENYSTSGTQNERGTGLGLILCKEFIEKHGGKIWVESEEGKGSIFYFTIPEHPYPEEKVVVENVFPVDDADELL